MHNPVNYVASSQFLPEKELVEFARKHADKYRIDVVTPTHLLVSNWFVDKMLDDFRAEFPELCERTRAEKIAALMERNRAEASNA